MNVFLLEQARSNRIRKIFNAVIRCFGCITYVWFTVNTSTVYEPFIYRLNGFALRIHLPLIKNSFRAFLRIWERIITKFHKGLSSVIALYSVSLYGQRYVYVYKAPQITSAGCQHHKSGKALRVKRCNFALINPHSVKRL